MSELSVTLNPSINGAILTSTDSTWIEFNMPVLHEDTEKIISLKTFNGSILYETEWTGNRLSLTPTEGWSPGVLYSFSCDGIIKTINGLSFTVNESVSFYVVSSAPPPVLLSYSPGEDSICDRDMTISLVFNKPIRANNLSDYITITPSHQIDISLSNDMETVVVSPIGEWEGLERYTWSVSDELLDTEGIKAIKRYSGSFRTLADVVPPGNPSVFAVDLQNVELRQSIELLDNDMGLLFAFDEDIDTENFRKQFSIEPDINPVFRVLNDTSIIVYPENNTWIPGKEYSVSIKKGFMDISGNKTNEDYAFTVTSRIPALQIISIANLPDLPDASFEGNELLSKTPLKIGLNALELNHTFTIRLSRQITREEAERFADCVSIEGLFPGYVSNATLTFVQITGNSDDRIRMTYKFPKLDSLIPSERIYYKLTIKGGSGGFVTDDGSYFLDDFILFLERVAE